MDFAGVTIGPSVLVDVATAGVGCGLLGCDFLLNLRDFKSEALVLGNGIAVCFDDESIGVWVVIAVLEGVVFVGLCFWFTAEVLGVPEMRRFF